LSASPIERFIDAIDVLDVETAVTLMGPDCVLLTTTGDTAEGAGPVSKLLAEFLDPVRSTAHRILTHWHVDDVWIAEVEADYELTNDTRIGSLPRAIFWASQPNGSAVVHFYGAHEGAIRDLGKPAGAMLLDGHWIPPL
jgi:hypothetical protein